MRGGLSVVAANAEQPKERGALLHWEQVRDRLPKPLRGEWAELSVKRIMKKIGTHRLHRTNYVYEGDLATFLEQLPKTGPGKGGHPVP